MAQIVRVHGRSIGILLAEQGHGEDHFITDEAALQKGSHPLEDARTQKPFHDRAMQHDPVASIAQGLIRQENGPLPQLPGAEWTHPVGVLCRFGVHQPHPHLDLASRINPLLLHHLLEARIQQPVHPVIGRHTLTGLKSCRFPLTGDPGDRLLQLHRITETQPAAGAVLLQQPLDPG